MSQSFLFSKNYKCLEVKFKTLSKNITHDFREGPFCEENDFILRNLKQSLHR